VHTPVYRPVHNTVQNSALPGVEPPRLSTEERKSERWTIYMPRWIRQRIERAAALEGMSPSQFLQRLCGPWAATWQDPEADATPPPALLLSLSRRYYNVGARSPGAEDPNAGEGSECAPRR